MVAFQDLLAQVSAAHEADVAELREQVAQLQHRHDGCCAGNSAAASDGDRVESCQCSDYELDEEAQHPSPLCVPEALHRAPSILVPEEWHMEPIIKVFGTEVRNLGLRILWNNARPVIQHVEQGAAAQEVGICGGDYLQAINGTDTLGRSREELLPLLRVRPLTLELQRKVASPSTSLNFGQRHSSMPMYSSIQSSRSPVAASARHENTKAKLLAIKEKYVSEDTINNRYPALNEEATQGNHTPVSTKSVKICPRSPLSPRNISDRNLSKTSGEPKSSEGTASYLGMRRFITARKESTASVAHVAIGNFKISFHEDGHSQHSSCRSMGAMLHSTLKWWSHLEEPESEPLALRNCWSLEFSSHYHPR
ncbi:unnamed protein product [Effrenium voratum]|nr:unnamed protein product [Effrenium voratum]